MTVTAPASVEVAEAEPEGTRPGDGVLRLGTLFPQTGSLAFLGPPMVAGAELALGDINAAGGVLGHDVELSAGDSGDTTTSTALDTVDRLLGEQVDAIVGAASSSVTLNVIDRIVAAGVIQISPGNAANKLSAYPDKGLYFRTAPADNLEGSGLGNLVVGSGARSVEIVARDDAYGRDVGAAIAAALNDGGVAVNTTIYDPDAVTFDAEVARIKDASPDAVVLVSFNEASRILRALVAAGVGPQQVPTFGVDGWIGNGVGADFDAGR